MFTDTRATLDIQSTTHSAAAVTTLLGIEPTLIAERGEQRFRVGSGVREVDRGHTRRVERRSLATSLWSYATAPTDAESSVDPLEALIDLVLMFRNKADLLAALRVNYTTRLWCTGYSNTGRGGFIMASDLMGDIGALGCDFFCTVHFDNAGNSEVRGDAGLDRLALV
jgi:hypothetical protein